MANTHFNTDDEISDLKEYNLTELKGNNKNFVSDKMTADRVTTNLVNKTSSIDDDDDDNMPTDVIIDDRILARRLRKTNVFSRDEDIENNSDLMKLEEANAEPDEMGNFPCVVKLVKMYTSMLQHRQTEAWQPVRERAPRLSPDGGIWTSESSREEEDDEQARTLDNEQETDTNDDASRMMNRSPISDEGCATTQSPYASSDDEDVASGNRVRGRRRRDKVVRSSSSDSALGLEEDQPPAAPVRRMTLTVADIPLRPALLPLAEPTTLTCCGQVSTTQVDQCGCGVRSRTLLEAQLIEIPADGGATTLINCATEDQLSSPMSAPHSRRESAQSFHSDVGNIGTLGDHAARVRYVRTPSVVVSDYSDDIMCGITLEEIEYFRRQRLRRSSTDLISGDNDGSDLSAASSCSNLNYCGSHISALDGSDCYQQQAGLQTPERKISNCSTCSTLSGDDEDSSFPLRLAEAIQRQHQQQKKKVSLNPSLDVIEVNSSDNIDNQNEQLTQESTALASMTTPPPSPVMMMSVITTDKSKV